MALSLSSKIGSRSQSLRNILPSIEFDEIRRAAVSEFVDSQISLEDAARLIMAEFVRRDRLGIESSQPNAEKQPWRDVCEILDSFGVDYSDDEYRRLHRYLDKQGLVSITGDVALGLEGIPDAFLTEEGYERGDFELQRLAMIAIGNLEAIPVADGFVEFGHNSLLVLEVEERVNAAISVISASNTLVPEQKNIFLDALSAGKALLKSPKTYIAAISALLMKPLYDAYCSVLEDAAKPIIEAALALVKQLLGL
jgi:hypothetical protein